MKDIIPISEPTPIMQMLDEATAITKLQELHRKYTQAEKVSEKHIREIQRARRKLNADIEAGLIAIKASVGDGHFKNWLQQAGFPESSAYRCIGLAKKLKSEPESDSTKSNVEPQPADSERKQESALAEEILKNATHKPRGSTAFNPRTFKTDKPASPVLPDDMPDSPLPDLPDEAAEVPAADLPDNLPQENGKTELRRRLTDLGYGPVEVLASALTRNRLKVVFEDIAKPEVEDLIEGTALSTRNHASVKPAGTAITAERAFGIDLGLRSITMVALAIHRAYAASASQTNFLSSR